MMPYSSGGWHYHWCEECLDETIACDLPYCEYQDDAIGDLIEEHYKEEHGEDEDTIL